MRLGVFSDTHDRLEKIEHAARVFVDQGVDLIVHCGDMIAPFIKNALSIVEASGTPAVGVYGNNDGERAGIVKIMGGILKVEGDVLELERAGKKIVVYHGTSLTLLNALIHSGRYDLVLTGHTHQKRVEMVNQTLVVNPGEGCGYLTGEATIAIVELLEGRPLQPSDVTIVPLL
jgi:putative phosphoesterase